jgi:2-oxoglutarate dehydrogenase E1 component
MSDVDGVNAGYARLLLDEYLDNPEAVPPEWRSLFETGDTAVVRDVARLLERLPARGNGGSNGGAAVVAPPAPVQPAAAPPAAVTSETETEPATARQPEPAPDAELLGGVAAAMALVKAHRMHGHLAARLDPLGSEPIGDPALDPLRLEPKLTPELQARIPTSILRIHVDGPTLREALPRLKETYCGAMAYEMEHISDHEQRVWLRKAIEAWRFRTPFEPEAQRALYARLCDVEGMERYLRRSFLGQKQFSLEGLDVLIPMLDESIELAAASGAREVVLGMAHRGRLNVLAHTIGLPYEQILREFEGERAIEVVAADVEGGTGDVKYHLGAEGIRTTASGTIAVTVAANPSHLEAVNPVVEGMTRAAQTDRRSRDGAHDPTAAMPILLHGDAAFAGQGIVAETLNLYALEGYSTGGTLHIITNNQVGFTTDPTQGRSTRYSSDLAKGFDTPIIHVNADDPEAALSAVRLALAYRARFGHDIVIDLVGYRRFGHNEQDEPAYTQPIMAGQIESHPTVRELYAAKLVEQGVLTEAEARELDEAVTARLHEAHDRLRASFGQNIPAKSHEEPVPRSGDQAPVETAVPAKRLRRLTERLMQVSDGFTINPKLERQLERRLTAVDEGGIDWGHAEALAFASLIRQGVPVRLTGQDSERGTFSHRHLVLHDAHTGEIEIPMQQLKGSKASFEVYNSPLSEYSCVGFEYGYSTAASEALVLWEAQFGDFANGAQTIIDQFISSGLAKWRQTSRLTLLLPHGYEGNGPEHSSARLERFLQLAAQENMRIANCTTSAQYFHLLRRQALDPVALPLVVMTPKGLLRLKDAASSLDDLANGTFGPVLDAVGPDKPEVRRLVLCTGKVYYDIVGHAAATDVHEVAVARLEQLYPFPVEAAREVIASYPRLGEIVWAQEEPQNMGAWRTIRHRLEEAAGGIPVRYVGRPWRASTAEGYPTAHTLEQERIALAALTV